MPLDSYLRNSFRFGIMPPLVHEKAGVKHLRDLTGKSINFITLAASNIRLLLFFSEEDQ